MEAKDFNKNFKQLQTYNKDAIFEYQKMKIVGKDKSNEDLSMGDDAIFFKISLSDTYFAAIFTRENLETMLNELKPIENDGNK